MLSSYYSLDMPTPRLVYSDRYFKFDMNESDHPQELLYQAAVKFDSDKIKELLNPVSIDVRDKTNRTAAGRLAEENNVTAVNFLVDNFNASLKGVAFGYAKGGHTPSVDELLEKYPSRSKYLLHDVVAGYASAKNFGIPNDIMEDEDDNIETLQIAYAFGYGLSGGVLGDFLKNYANDLFSIVESMATGYAQGGHEDQANILLNAYPSFRYQIIRVLAGNYGITDNQIALKNLLESHTNLQLEIWNEALYGFAHSRLFNRIKQTFRYNELLCEASVKKVASGFAAGGNTLESEKIIEQHPQFSQMRDAVYCSMALNGHFEDLKSGIGKDISLKNYRSYLVLGYAYFGEEEIIDAFKLVTFDLDIEQYRIKGFALARKTFKVNEILDTEADGEVQKKLAISAMSGFAAIGYTSGIEFLLDNYQEYRTEFSYALVPGLCLKGFYNFLMSYLEKFNYKEDLLLLAGRSLASNDYFNEAANLYNRIDHSHRMLVGIANVAISADFYNNYVKTVAKVFFGKYSRKDDILRNLVFICNHDFRVVLGRAVDLLNDYLLLDVNALPPRAEIIYRSIQCHKISYNKAVGWVNPKLKFWFLHPGFAAKLTPGIYLMIASYLVNLPRDEILLMGNQHYRLFRPGQPIPALFTENGVNERMNLLTESKPVPVAKRKLNFDSLPSSDKENADPNADSGDNNQVVKRVTR